LVREKSPDATMLVIPREVPPELTKVKDCDGLGVPTAKLPNVKLGTDNTPKAGVGVLEFVAPHDERYTTEQARKSTQIKRRIEFSLGMLFAHTGGI
jgi:hypothetical protein